LVHVVRLDEIEQYVQPVAGPLSAYHVPLMKHSVVEHVPEWHRPSEHDEPSVKGVHEVRLVATEHFWHALAGFAPPSAYQVPLM
jgi:hypothetical protein